MILYIEKVIVDDMPGMFTVGVGCEAGVCQMER